MNLHQKLIEIRKEIDSFTKDSQSYGYSYVSGSQVLSKIQDKMNELGVLLYPKMDGLNHETFDYQAYNKTTKKFEARTDFVVTGHMTYVWQNADEPSETIEIEWGIFGQQNDISKAYGSGLTYSERYFLLKFFNAPTDEEDPDKRDTGGKSSSNATASDKQLNFVTNLLRSKGSTNDERNQYFTKMIGELKLSPKMMEWTSSDASKVIKHLQDDKNVS